MYKKILLIITVLFFCSACSNNYLKKINLKALNKLIDNKETFVLYLTDEIDGKILKNTLSDVLIENKFNSYYINTKKLSSDELKSLKNIFMFEETNIILFVKEGKEETVLSRINDLYISKKDLEQELKIQGYIEKEN